MEINKVKKIQKEWDEVSKKAGVIDELVLKTNSYFAHSTLMLYKVHIINQLKPLRDSLWLDVCCGTGPNSIILASKYGSRVVSFDISLGALRRGCRMKNHFGIDKIDFVNADLHHLPFREGLFDGAIATQSFSYYSLEEQKTIIKNLFPFLKENGLFLISDASRGSSNYHLFNSSAYSKLLEEVGFSILEEKEWGHELYDLLNKFRLRLLLTIQNTKHARILLYKVLLAYTRIVYKISILENYIRKKNSLMFHVIVKK